LRFLTPKEFVVTELQYQGRFVWHDLMTTDPGSSQAFFAGLFGWTAEPVDMGGVTYTVLKRDGEQFGGLMALDPEHGLPSHWISYLSTGDVDDLCARASDMGATVGVQPTDIPNVGRFAVVGDPQGAWFSPLSEAERAPLRSPSVDAAPGEVVWNELVTSDVEAATAFYTRLFGLEPKVMDVGTGPYTLLYNGPVPVAGILKKPDDMPVPAWVIYFEADDIDAAVERIAALGGTVLFPPMQVPTVGRLTWATDPAGATFAIMQSERAAEQGT
jgi:predicted enzyme related to lactoylglutathione lyase